MKIYERTATQGFGRRKWQNERPMASHRSPNSHFWVILSTCNYYQQKSNTTWFTGAGVRLKTPVSSESLFADYTLWIVVAHGDSVATAWQQHQGSGGLQILKQHSDLWMCAYQNSAKTFAVTCRDGGYGGSLKCTACTMALMYGSQRAAVKNSSCTLLQHWADC